MRITTAPACRRRNIFFPSMGIPKPIEHRHVGVRQRANIDFRLNADLPNLLLHADAQAIAWRTGSLSIDRSGDVTMENESQQAQAGESMPDRALGQIGKCLRMGCVICIEHTAKMSSRFTPWQVWGQPSCYNGDQQHIHSEIDRCRSQHADHHIRLNIEDYSCHSRFSFAVHRPSLDAET